MRKLLILVCCLHGGVMMAQAFSISGRVADTEKTNLSFVNVLVFEPDAENPFKGTTTNEDGTFMLKEIPAGTYTLRFSYIGFADHEESVALSSTLNIGTIILKEDPQLLEETVVSAPLPSIRKMTGKLVFNVENTSLSVGNTLELLKKTPGVVVIGENIQVKFSNPIIFINGKRVYLSSSEVISLLENTDASNVKSVEVITNPSAKYDADAGTVLNIITSKSISIGYKGSVNGSYEQGVYPKFKTGNSHFYKKSWLQLYAGYTYSNRKDYKEDESYIRFFEPNGIDSKSIFETNFDRTTNHKNHNGNLVLDFTLDAKNSINLTSNISVTPFIDYNNNGMSRIYNPQRQLDSTITTLSSVNYEKNNWSSAVEYKRILNDAGAALSTTANYIYYNNHQTQSVDSDYFLADGDFLRNNSFYTDSRQNNNIFTAQTDLSTEMWGGNFEAGLKFSSVNTESKLDYFDTPNNSNGYNATLSDDFQYKENIYSEYINFERAWEKWSVSAGLRGEFTDIDGVSHSMGQVNSQSYFKIFPSASLHYTINPNNGIGLSYSRSLDRPRYQSLNPFKYYITERDYTSGNPNLEPAIKDRVVLTVDHKGKLFFEFYYENIAHSLDLLTFQNNENSTIERIDANLINSFQYAFDVTYFDSLTTWWWVHINTSSFYYANEFYTQKRTSEKYTNDTFGQYLFATNHFTFTKDRTFTADLTGSYISNFVFGNRYFKNQFFANISFRKDLWNKRASVTLGVDDIFDTLKDVASTARYYNQDNYFYAKMEHRLVRVGFKYNFGNARLRDNHKKIEIEETDRLKD